MALPEASDGTVHVAKLAPRLRAQRDHLDEEGHKFAVVERRHDTAAAAQRVLDPRKRLGDDEE